MYCRVILSLTLASALLLITAPTARASLLNDHFEGDSLKAQWAVTGAIGTYSVSGGLLHVTDITPKATWSDMFFTAQFVAQEDFNIAVGYDYPYIQYKRFALILLNNRAEVVAHLMLEDSPSNWLVFDVASCYELISRPTIPSWISVSRAGDVLTVEWEGYAPRTCTLSDTIAFVQLMFSRWGNQPFNGFSVDSVVAASSNAPSLNNITLDGDVAANHLTNHSPLISWEFSDADGDAQHLVDIEVGSDDDWLNGAEMWASQVVGDSTGITYNGLVLLDGTDYWVRVRANDSLVWSLWTERVFHMNGVPSFPTQVNPGGFGEVDSNPPTLVAVAGPDTESDTQQLNFGIYMDDTILVQESGLWPVTPGIAGDTVSWTATDSLVENWSYFWTVQSFDGFEMTPQFGAMEFFFVNALDEPPSQTLLYGPGNDSIVFSTFPEFAWSQATDPDPHDTLSYRFDIALNSIFSGALEVPDLMDTIYSLFTPLELGTRYWWRVLSQDSDSLEATSLASQFRIYKPGDANGSWDVSSSDIITLVNYVFKSVPMPVPECAGRVNGDEIVNASDIIYLVNYVFKGGVEPVGGCQ